MQGTNKPALVEEKYFPFECSTSYGVEDDYKQLHWHREMEICYIKQGTGMYLINGVDYPFSKGDIFVISDDEIHLCHDDKDLVMQVIMFAPNFLQSGFLNPFDYEYLRPFLEHSDHFTNKLSSDTPVTQQLATILTEIENEYNTMQSGYELMIKALLLRFLALIIRHCLSDIAPGSTLSPGTADKIRQVVAYMDEHFEESISLQMLSEQFHISTPYLCSAFKSLTGSAPIDFLVHRRILEAKRLLSASDMRIIQISEACGFRSLSNFNHQFKELVGVTPSAYRKMCKGK
ncbi:MAG: AraC family transcriptional regulator [Oscillospiraceae bacterium]|nr:AraC family transcriptional regulator [Oscillospiraceae bacterium]